MSYHWGYSPVGSGTGIRAVSRSGGFGESWLAREWSDLLGLTAERSVISAGASMARRGAVHSITVAPGHISGRVLEYSTLYAVEMDLPVLSDVMREVLLDALASEPLVAAQILGGTVPRDLFTLDMQGQWGLFPTSLLDFDSACGCYRWEVPCKHIAAMHLLVAEEFDRDPLLFFVLRGIDRGTLLGHLGGGLPDAPAPPLPVAPLPTDPVAFWDGGSGGSPFAEDAGTTAPLTPFPFWGGTRPFDAVMTEYLARAADRARAEIATAFPPVTEGAERENPPASALPDAS